MITFIGKPFDRFCLNIANGSIADEDEVKDEAAGAGGCGGREEEEEVELKFGLLACIVDLMPWSRGGGPRADVVGGGA